MNKETTMPSRSLGHSQWELPVIGLGCMGLSEFYGPAMEPNAAIKLLHEALDLGVVHYDTAEIYGMGAANETLLGQAFVDRREPRRSSIAESACFWPASLV
jgi:aryl-alcohol dehydrogenase-like predicted oxidoreductase